MNQDFSNFLTIGELAKLSAVHIKALRYYESIGILTPTAINSENGYRYYSYPHITYVKVIKICANYGLPLKTFTQYILEDNKINMLAILNAASKEIKKQEKQLKVHQQYLQKMEQQVKLSQRLDNSVQYHIETLKETFLLTPFQGEMLSQAYFKSVHQILSQLEKFHLSYENRVGCYYLYTHDKFEQYLAIKVEKPKKPAASLKFLELNYQHLHAEHVNKAHIDAWIIENHKKEKHTEFLALETFENPMDLTNPHLELRYVLS